MRIKITDECIACGLCVDIAPQLFEMNDLLGRAVSKRAPEVGEEDKAREAADSCPVEAIKLEE
jgi:ferredoxin